MKKLSILIIILSMFLFSKNAQSYHDNMTWWYSNASGQPGSYMIAGPGVDSSNGGYYGGYYWKGTYERPGAMSFRRDLLSGTGSVYLNEQLQKSIDYTYITGEENKVKLTAVVGHSAGNVSLDAVYIRYHNDGIWSDWIDLSFSAVFPVTTGTELYESTIISLKTDEAYDAYEISYNMTIPSVSSNKHLRLHVDTINDPENSFDPLNPPIPIPEPTSIFLLGLSSIWCIKKKLK